MRNNFFLHNLHKVRIGADAAVISGVLVLLLFFTLFYPINVQAQSVSDNAYSETQIDTSSGDVMDETGHVTNEQQAEEQKQEEIQTNSITGWPQGPAITAESAILTDADTGTILYAKNIHEKMYPASTTKMLTCLLAAEHLDLNDTITFSQSAIDAVPADGSNIGMSVGETITVEQALYGLMVGSANECANALAEEVSGSIDAFVNLMNERASELGCEDSHFVNTNGLYDDDHYTSAYDLSRIAAAFFENDVCRTVGNCASYHFEATATQPDDFTLTNKHALITGEVSYSGIIGGKTGYTSQSHENLVTGCIQNDTELIAVVMREDDPAQFNDTVTLFDYGYDNFTKKSAEENAALPTDDASPYLSMGSDLLGTSTPALVIKEGGYVDLPDTASFSDLTAVYGNDNSITYYFGEAEEDIIVGSAVLSPSTAEWADSVHETAVSDRGSSDHTLSEFLETAASQYITTGLNGTIYVNVFSFLMTIIAFSAIFALYFRIRSSALHHARQQARKRQRRARRAHSGRDDDYHNHRNRSSEYYDPYESGAYYQNDDYDNGFSSSYTASNNYRDEYYGRDSWYHDDYGDYNG